jgi:hypothetical protein
MIMLVSEALGQIKFPCDTHAFVMMKYTALPIVVTSKLDLPTFKSMWSLPYAFCVRGAVQNSGRLHTFLPSAASRRRYHHIDGEI